MRKITLFIALTIGLFAYQPVAAQILGEQWMGAFYNNTLLSGDPVATVSYPNGIYFNWGSGSPAEADNMTHVAGVAADNFSAVFTSTQTFHSPGIYIFTIYVDDGLRVYFDGELMLDQFNETLWDDSPRTFVFHRYIAGQSEIDIRLEYVEYSGPALIGFQWGLTQYHQLALYFPANGSPVIGDASPVLQWYVMGTPSYRVTLKDADGIIFKRDFVASDICSPQRCELDLADTPTGIGYALKNGEYRWRVVAQMGSGLNIRSAQWGFRIRFPGKPKGLNPNGGEAVTSGSPVLTWNVVPAAAEYRVRILRQANGADTTVDWFTAGCDPTTCTLDLGALETPIVLQPGKYKWHVRARDLSVVPTVMKSKTATFKILPGARETDTGIVPPPSVPDFRAP